MKPRILPHAIRHGLSKHEVCYAWEHRGPERMRSANDEPLRWIAIGFLPDGRSAEMCAFQDEEGRWVVYHAFTPPTKKFKKELESLRRRN